MTLKDVHESRIAFIMEASLATDMARRLYREQYRYENVLSALREYYMPCEDWEDEQGIPNVRARIQYE